MRLPCTAVASWPCHQAASLRAPGSRVAVDDDDSSAALRLQRRRWRNALPPRTTLAAKPSLPISVSRSFVPMHPRWRRRVTSRSRSLRRSSPIDTVRASVSMTRPRYVMRVDGPSCLSGLQRKPSQLNTETAVAISAAHCSSVSAAHIRSSTYMLAESPIEVRNWTISPARPQAKAGATLRPSGTPERRRYGG